MKLRWSMTSMLVLEAALVGTATTHAAAVDTAFTYQGQLHLNGQPVNGAADFVFALRPVESGGGLTLASRTYYGVEIVNGIFTVLLDFGNVILDERSKWLEVKVRYPAGDGDYTTLAPRQPLTPTPYALHMRGLTVDTDDNVGIGTDFPSYPLHVESTQPYSLYVRSDASLDDSAAGFFRTDTSDGVGVWALATDVTGPNFGVRGESRSTHGTAVYARVTASAGTTYGVYSRTLSPDGFAGYFAGGRNYFQGRVGIGTESPSDETSLHIQARDNDFGVLVDAIGAPGSEIGLHAGASGYSSLVKNAFYAGSWSRFDETKGALLQEVEPDGDLRLDVAPAGAGTIDWNTALFLSADGSVGIGTTSPQEKLHISGANANLLLREGGGNPYVELGDSTVQRGYLQWISASNRMLLYTSAHAYPIAIGPTGSGGVFIDTEANGGEVGINTETPAFELHVNGTAGKPGGGSWSNSSDRRLKKNIHTLEGSLERLLSLRGVTFEYKDPKSINELPGERIGMIAQEVEPVFPDWVGVGGHGFKTLTYRGFEALAVEALRDLRCEKDRELQSQASRIAQLESEVEALRERLTALEALLVLKGEVDAAIERPE